MTNDGTFGAALGAVPAPQRQYHRKGNGRGVAHRLEGSCAVRNSGTNVSTVNSLWWQTDTGRTLKGPWVRLSPDAGAAQPYPYAMELTYCGSLRTYELAFATNSDTLQGTDWPILAAVADVLKTSGSMKIEVGGHTDSTGDAKKNRELSERRSAAVKQALVGKYGADGARIGMKGWGAEQPIQDNTTEDNRALNRRVEIVLSR